MKYRDERVPKILAMYALGRYTTKGGYSKGLFSLRNISELYNVPIGSVNKIVKGV